MKRILLALCVSCVLFLPAFVQAAELVPCGDADQETCQTCHVVTLVNNVIDWLIKILGTIAAIMFMWAGFKLVTSQGNTSAKTEAKRIANNIIIGYIIVLSAWLLVDYGLKALLGTGESGFGMWNEIECVSQPEPRFPDTLAGGAIIDYNCENESACQMLETDCTATGGTPTRLAPVAPTTVSCEYSAGGTYTGSCELISSGACSVAALGTYFPGRAEDASRICNKESGGQPVQSGSDRCCGRDGSCSGDPSFSGGYFQINILAHSDKIPGCNLSSFFNKNGNNSPQGDCVSRNGEGICIGWSCTITRGPAYDTCMRGALDHTLNLSIAAQLYAGRGNHFDDWRNSANRCSIPL